jgi:fatty acid desaturase
MGLHRRRYWFYWSAFVAAAGAFVLLSGGVVLLRESWLVIVCAPALALVCAQIGFLGHEAAHRQVFASARWNEWAARILSGVFAGLSYGWWLHKHNRHHARPNQLERDPDIAPGVLAFTPQAAATRTGLAARFTRHQGRLFFLLLPFEGINLHVQSVARILSRHPLRWRGVEASFLVVRLGGFVAALFLLLPPSRAAIFLAVQLGVFGVLLGGAFAPNHIGMPIVPAGARPDFLQRQVLVSRNVRGGRLLGFFMGGLQYQIEHHLFPSLPRPALAKVRPLVRAHCAAHGVPYEETTLFEAYRRIVSHLNGVGRRGADPFRCPMVTLHRN